MLQRDRVKLVGVMFYDFILYLFKFLSDLYC